MAWPVLVFDIETIPDVAGLRLLNPCEDPQSDEQVHAAWVQARKDKGQSDFLPLYLHPPGTAEHQHP